jgi:hypothetical protein
MARGNRTVIRVVSLVVAMLLFSGWVMPAHSCTETKQGAAIHCVEMPEFDTYALLVQDGIFIVRPQVIACSLSHFTLNPQMLVFTIYRPPQA